MISVGNAGASAVAFGWISGGKNGWTGQLAWGAELAVAFGWLSGGRNGGTGQLAWGGGAGSSLVVYCAQWAVGLAVGRFSVEAGSLGVHWGSEEERG